MMTDLVIINILIEMNNIRITTGTIEIKFRRRHKLGGFSFYFSNLGHNWIKVVDKDELVSYVDDFLHFMMINEKRDYVEIQIPTLPPLKIHVDALGFEEKGRIINQLNNYLNNPPSIF